MNASDLDSISKLWPEFLMMTSVSALVIMGIFWRDPIGEFIATLRTAHVKVHSKGMELDLRSESKGDAPPLALPDVPPPDNRPRLDYSEPLALPTPVPVIQLSNPIPDITVGAHGADYSTIQEAVDASDSANRILVSPGIYEEALRVMKPVQILARPGIEGEVIIRSSTGSPLLVAAPFASFSKLTFENIGEKSETGPVSDAATVSLGQFTFTDCTFKHANGNGLYAQEVRMELRGCKFVEVADSPIFGTGDISLDGCTVTGVKCITLFRGSSLTMRNCTIRQSLDGLHLWDVREADIRSSTFEDIQESAIIIRDGAVTVSECTFVRCGGPAAFAIGATDGAKLSLLGNHFTSCTAVVLYDQSEGTITNNSFERGSGAVACLEQVQASITKNRFTACETVATVRFSDDSKVRCTDNEFLVCDTAIMVSDNANLHASTNRISTCKKTGVFVTDKSTVEFELNEVCDGLDRGLVVSGAIKCTIANNSFSKNALSQIRLSGGASVVVCENTIENGGGGGIACEIRATIESNVIRGNGLSGILLRGESDATIRLNTISGNTQAGVFVFEGGNATLLENEISNNGFNGVRVGDSSGKPCNALISQNVVARNSRYGVTVLTRSTAMVTGNKFVDNGLGATKVEKDAEVTVVRNTVE